MKKVYAVFKREYLTRVKTKGFVIGTIMMPVFLLLIMLIPALLTMTSADVQRRLAVIDFSDHVYPLFAESLSSTEKLNSGESMYLLENIIIKPDELTNEKRKLDSLVTQGKLYAYIVIPADVFETNRVEFYAKNISSFTVNEMIRSKLSQVISNIRLNDSGMDPDVVKALIHRTDLITFRVSPEGSKEEPGELSFLKSYGLVLFLYMALLLYGQFIMRSIIEDKNSRVIEVIVSSMRPEQLMAGKIIGVGAAGLTQFIIWALFAWAASSYGLYMVNTLFAGTSQIPVIHISTSVLLYFVIFFILGYFLYSGLYAAIGAIVNQESEAQSMQWPVMSFLILAFLLIFWVINNPDSDISVILSLIPLFTPILMFMRISVQSAPPIEIGASIVLMLLSIAGLIWLTAKIFRVGILMYGKRPTLPELARWIKYG